MATNPSATLRSGSLSMFCAQTGRARSSSVGGISSKVEIDMRASVVYGIGKAASAMCSVCIIQHIYGTTRILLKSVPHSITVQKPNCNAEQTNVHRERTSADESELEPSSNFTPKF